MEIIEEVEPSSHGQSDESTDDSNIVKETKTIHAKVQEQKPQKFRGPRPSPLEVLNHVKMNNTRETPRSTIKSFLNVPKQTELKFNRENLKKVEEQLKQAFVEFYHKLRLLKSYR